MMKRTVAFLMAVVAGFSVMMAREEVYRLNLDDEIGSTTWRYTRQAVAKAREKGNPLLLVHLNTYGGSVVHADSIRTALLHYPGKTVAFVDNNAASAGALIALSCDSVYMRRDATMGAVTVVNGNDGAAMPDKYQSYMRAMMRATAESHGKDSAGNWRRNPLIAEAMVDPRIVVAGLIDSTKVLTFTASEAEKWGFSDGMAESVGEVMEKIGVDNPVVEEYKPDFDDRLMGFLTNPALQAILVMIIIGGIYFELQTPGLGFPTVAAITAAVIYFLPMLIEGIVAPWVAIVFVLGLLLFLLEIFVIPGFGVCGIAGIVCMAVSIFFALVQNFEVTPVGTGTVLPAIWQAVLTFAMAMLLAVVGVFALTSRFGPAFVRKRAALTHSQKIEDGYIGVDARMKEYVGSEGVTVTDMRPSGKIAIGDEEFDAVSLDGFLESGVRVRIVKWENAQLYVRGLRNG